MPRSVPWLAVQFGESGKFLDYGISLIRKTDTAFLLDYGFSCAWKSSTNTCLLGKSRSGPWTAATLPASSF